MEKEAWRIILKQMDLKVKAHIGDALVALFSRLLLHDKIDKQRYFAHSSKMVSNEHFTETVVEFDILELSKKPTYFDHRDIGTQYEAIIYDIYVEGGFDAAFNFFKKTAYRHYSKKYSHLLLAIDPKTTITK